MTVEVEVDMRVVSAYRWFNNTLHPVSLVHTATMWMTWMI